MCQICEITNGDYFDFGVLVVRGFVPEALTADHVEVQARTADVLADFIDQQNVR